MMNNNININSSKYTDTKDTSLNKDENNLTYDFQSLSNLEYKPLLIDRIFSSKKICDSVIMHYNTTIFYIHGNISSFKDNDKICITTADISYSCIGSNSPLTFNFNNSSYEGNLVEPPECILNFETHSNKEISDFFLSNVNELIYNSFLIYHTAFYDDIFSKDNSSNKSLLLITQALFFFTGAIKRTAITPYTNLTIKNARTLLISGLESIKAAINFHDHSLKLYRKFSSVVHTKKYSNEEGPTSSFFIKQLILLLQVI